MTPCTIGLSLVGEAPGRFLFGSFLKLSFVSEPKQQRGYGLPRYYKDRKAQACRVTRFQSVPGMLGIRVETLAYFSTIQMFLN